MPNNHTTVEVDVLPDCDFCGSPASVDGATRPSSWGRGQWANMCERHWANEGVGRLGLGQGQRLVLRQPRLTQTPFASVTLDEV